MHVYGLSAAATRGESPVHRSGVDTPRRSIPQLVAGVGVAMLLGAGVYRLTDRPWSEGLLRGLLVGVVVSVFLMIDDYRRRRRRHSP